MFLGAVERGHVVLHLGRVERTRDALQRRSHLLGDLMEPVGDDFKSDGGDAVTCRVHGSSSVS